MFEVVTDPGRRLVDVKISGFLSLADVAAFGREEQAAARTLGCASGDYRAVADISGMVLQSQEVLAAFQDFLALSPMKAGRLAFVVGRSLAHRQIRRILTRPQAKVFQTREEAEAWLFSEDPAVVRRVA